jgi:hypothetical protein
LQSFSVHGVISTSPCQFSSLTAKAKTGTKQGHPLAGLVSTTPNEDGFIFSGKGRAMGDTNIDLYRRASPLDPTLSGTVKVKT